MHSQRSFSPAMTDTSPQAMKLAILAPLHLNDETKAIRQFKNYEYWLSESGITRHYFIHVSTESSLEALDNLTSFLKLAEIPHSISPRSAPTSFNTCLNAILSLDQALRRHGELFSHIYYHTDSDLLFMNGLAEEISKYNSGIGILGRLGYEKTKWYHAERMRKDSRLNEFVTSVLKGNYDSLYIGRTEGMFAINSIWSLTNDIINSFFSDDFFDNAKNHWCAEEILFPTLFMLISGLTGSKTACRKNLIFSKTTGENRHDRIVSQEDISRLISEGEYFGAKWFEDGSVDSTITPN